MQSRWRKWLWRAREQVVGGIKRILPEQVRAWIRRLRTLRNERISRSFMNHQMKTPQLWDEYHGLVALNLANGLSKIMIRFYSELGVDPRSIPLVEVLQSFRSTLPAFENEGYQRESKPVLIRFERALALAETGRLSEALPLFESVFRDQEARKIIAYDPFIKEALVWSGEFLGRHHDKHGDVEVSIEVYRELISIERDGLVARRLMVLLSRRGDLNEAVEFGEVAMRFRQNLFPRLPKKNPYITRLEALFRSQ